ncbi:MAG: hypothetical protein U0S48_18525 [Solirubrobacteraceae bacterium]
MTEPPAGLVAQIAPGMHLCSADYRAWGDVLEVRPSGEDGGERPVIVGRVRESGRVVHVPAAAVLEVRGGRCVRLDAPLADLDDRPW